MDDKGDYILNGNNIIMQYPKTFAYGGVPFEYTGTNSTLERVNTTFARRLKRDLIVEVKLLMHAIYSKFRDDDIITKSFICRFYHEVRLL